VEIYLEITLEEKDKMKLERYKKYINEYDKIMEPLFEPERLYKIVEFEVQTIFERTKEWKLLAYGPKMRRGTETEWYEDVEK
jgi:hypothetical protein